MKKNKIIRPPSKGKNQKSNRSVRHATGIAIRSAPSLSTVLKPFFTTPESFVAQKVPPPPSKNVLIFGFGYSSRLKGDGEEIPMKPIFYSSHRANKLNVEIEQTPGFESCTVGDISKLFFQKCRVCCAFCNFTDISDKENRDIKLQTLKQLHSAMVNPNISRYLTNDSLSFLLHMIGVNIFRPLCYVPMTITDYAVNLEWEHLEIVYNLLTLLLNVHTFQMSAMQINNYIKNLFLMFLMPDKREQRAIGHCLYQFCHRFSESRAYIIKKCSSFLTAAQYDKATQYSLPVFLEFYLEAIALIKPNNPKSFARTHLMPLIMLSEFQNFHATLLKIVEVFIRRDSSFADYFLIHLFNHWPITSPCREALFLNAVHEIISSFNQQISEKTTKRLLERISSSFSDCTGEISQESLFMMQDDGMIKLILSKGTNCLNLIYSRIIDVSEHHWNSATRSFALDSLSYLKTSIPILKNLNMNEIKEKFLLDEQIQKDNWNKIRELASLNPCFKPLSEPDNQLQRSKSNINPEMKRVHSPTESNADRSIRRFKLNSSKLQV